jgi:hypothetical protein
MRRTRVPILATSLALALALAGHGSSAEAAIGQAAFVAFVPSAGAVPLVQGTHTAPICVDSGDWPGVTRAAGDLQADIERVTGRRPGLETTAAPSGETVIIVGTIGKSRLVDRLVSRGKIDVAKVRGRWEAYLIQSVNAPFPGIARALVIAGSDKRGSIFGIYELSGQIGVSPWYWWADVPPAPHDALFVAAGTRVIDAPVVRYRGIFINDEAPSFSGWAQEKFGGASHRMYQHVFELILRLRGNYLWPAMWLPRAFADDDPENARLADEYGVVIGTTHHEPMMRAHEEWGRYGKGEWDYSKNDAVLREFWRGGVERAKNDETIISLGMRGDGDQAMSEQTNVALLERIVADQRKILSGVLKRPLPEVPQLWALYKEVQGYYERGMRVPDDVTLLWCDDNWGNIRRLPTPEERKRLGGAGIYYHFDYVGGPRNYKWLNITPITKIWEQMRLAWQYDATRIWIVNVGDIKPMEFPIEFFLTYAWNPERWPYEKLKSYSEAWAAREFGTAHAAEIARLIDGYTKLNRRRTPELLEPETYSLIHYREAERVLGEWRGLVASAESIDVALPPQYRDAFYQLVLYPVKASAVVQELYVAAGLNKLYAVQGRASANREAARAHARFAENAALKKRYNVLGGGKWNHMMDEINLGYTYWQSPPVEVMPAVSDIRPNAGAEPAVALEGDPYGRPRWGTPPEVVPSVDRIRRNTRWVDVFNRGDAAFTFKASADQPWVRITPAAGSVQDEQRLEIGADWSAVPDSATGAVVTVETSAGAQFKIRVPIANTAPAPGSPAGTFVEADGHIAVDAPHFTRAVGQGSVRWQTLADFGRTTGGITTTPVLTPDAAPGGTSPRLTYDLQFAEAREVTIEFHFAPSLDFQPGEGLRFAWSLGDGAPQVLKLDTMQSTRVWEQAVADSVRKVLVKARVAAGHNVLSFWYVTPGVVLERIVIDAGGLRPSYLGPPESPRLPGR